jgi:hypothetical protein
LRTPPRRSGAPVPSNQPLRPAERAALQDDIRRKDALMSATALPSRLVFAAALGILCAAAATPAAAQQKVGVSAAVNPDASGTPPGAAVRRLVIGQEVVYNEHITTTANGQTQILFVDESAMTIGPNADVTIDQFVYDPKTGTGKLAMSAARGVLRFVGGKLSKEDGAVSIKTPSALIGVRGGALLANVKPGAPLQVIFIYGKALSVTGQSGCSQNVTRPSYGVGVASPGACPSSPAAATADDIAGLLAQLDGLPGANGGARVIPTDQAVASGVGNTISGDLAASIQASLQNLPPTTAASQVDVGNLQSQLQIQNGSLPANPGAISSAITLQPPTPGPYAGAFDGGGTTSSGFAGTPIPYSGGTLANGTFTATIGGVTASFPLPVGSSSFSGAQSPIGPVSGTTFLSSDSTFFYADLTAAGGQSGFIYGGLPVNSGFFSAVSPTTQISAFNVHPDAILQSPIPFAPNLGVSPTNVSSLYLATPANAPIMQSTSGTSGTKALQVSFGINNPSTPAQQSSVLMVTVGNIFNASLNGLGSPQPILNGITNGTFLNGGQTPGFVATPFVTGSDGNGRSFYGSNTISGFTVTNGNCCTSSGGQIATSGTVTSPTPLGTPQTTTSYQFNQPVTAGALPAGFATTQTSQTLVGYFGGIGLTTAGTALTEPSNPYTLAGTTSITTNAADLQVTAGLTGNDPLTSSTSGVSSLSLQFGSLSPGNTNARQAFITDSLYAALESPDTASQINGASATEPNTHIYFVTSAAAGPNPLLPNGLCQCQFIQWGYWGGDLTTPASGSNPARTDIYNINTWMAAPQSSLTSAADLTSLAGSANPTANYTGNLIGTVNSGNAQYLASGGLNASYNFATQMGSFAVSNYDGHSFAAAGSAPLSGPNYKLTITTPGINGAFNGSFFGPLASETGGNFSFGVGPTYFTSGIFGAVKH